MPGYQEGKLEEAMTNIFGYIMARAKLTVIIPEEVWIGELSRRYPEARFRVLSAFPEDESGFGLLEISSRDIEAILDEIQGAESVIRFDLVHRHEEEAIIQFETTAPLLLFPLRRAGVPLSMPFDIRDGEVDWELTSSHERLSELGNQLDALGIKFRVEYFRQEIEPQQLLTDQQQELLLAAIQSGYYDTPRGCSLTELAEQLDLAKSSVSETLHRAEERIIKEFIADLPDIPTETQELTAKTPDTD